MCLLMVTLTCSFNYATLLGREFDSCMSRDARKLVFGDSEQTQSDLDRHKKINRNLKFQILEEELLFYRGSANKGADQLCSYCTADLHLSLRIGKTQIFS